MSTSMPAWKRYCSPERILLLYIASNFLFMFLDVTLAHSYNKFAHQGEWIPVAYSLIGGLGVLVYALRTQRYDIEQTVLQCNLWIAFFVGVLGLYYHLSSAIYQEWTLKNLVYAAPIVAPLSYAGNALVGFVVCVPPVPSWVSPRRQLFLLVGIGFACNVLLTVFDHARNGFFAPAEWLAVFVSLWATIVMLWAGFKRCLSQADSITVGGTLVIQSVVGLLGFYLHCQAHTHNIMPTLIERLVYGAPIFAPLLFCDIAVLGFLVLCLDDTLRHWQAPW